MLIYMKIQYCPDKYGRLCVIISVGHQDIFGLSESGFRYAILQDRYVKSVIIDLRNVKEVGTEFLRMIYDFLKEASHRKKWTGICVNGERLRTTFILARLDRYAKVFNSPDEAVLYFNKRRICRWSFFLVLLFMTTIYTPTIKWVVLSWLKDPYYFHGPLVVATSAFFILRRLRYPDGLYPVLSIRGCGYIILALSIYFFGVLLCMNFLKAISLIFFLLGNVLLLGSNPIYQRCLFPIWILFFAIPLPGVEGLASSLQHITSSIVARSIRLLGMDIYNIGVTLFYAGRAITIDAPCAGLRSLIAVLFLTTLTTGLFRTTFLKKVIIFFGATLVTFLTNIIRISLLAMILFTSNINNNISHIHYISGLIFFIIPLSFLWLIRLCLKY